MRARRMLVLVIALVAVAASACGSSSNKSGGSSVTTTTTSLAAGSGSTAAVSGSTTSTSFTGSSGSSFCDFARQAQAAFAGRGTGGLRTPQQLKTLYQNVGPVLDHARSIAPGAIKADFDTFVHGYSQFLSAFAAANYDYTKVSRTALQAIGTSQMTAASQHITQYMRQVCGIGSTPST
jgi:hypothetical protein